MRLIKLILGAGLTLGSVGGCLDSGDQPDFAQPEQQDWRDRTDDEHHPDIDHDHGRSVMDENGRIEPEIVG